MKKDYYEVLGIDKGSDAAAIKKAYRKLAKKYHPDSNEGNQRAAEHFKEINEAYDVLGDEKKRKLYDQYGFAAFDENGNVRPEGSGFGSGYSSDGAYAHGDNSGFGGFGKGFGRGGFTHGFGSGYSGSCNDGSGYHEFHFEGSDAGNMDDILKHLFHGFGGGKASGHDSFSEEAFGKQSYGAGQNQGDLDLHADVTVSFDEAAFGGKRRISLQSSDGTVKSLEISIPAGIDSGKTIRLRGKGHQGRSGRIGDLLLKVTVSDKPGYTRKGMDVYTTVRIPFTTAVFGGEAKVQTIYGDVVCKIAAGTQSGSKIRLKGKGIVSMNDPKLHGDEYAQIEIRVPKSLSPDARQKLKEFQYACAG